jgi:hypothetical protein
VTLRIGGRAPVAASVCGSAMRSALAPVASKAVSVIPSGPVIRAAKNSAKSWPETTSTTRPSTSVDMLYSQVVPGSNINGNCASLPTRSALVWFSSIRSASRQTICTGESPNAA